MRWEQALRPSGGCCATASSAGEGSLGGTGSSGFRVGQVSASSFRSRGAWMDAAGDGRRPASSVESRTSRRRARFGDRGSSVPAGARRSSSSRSACRSSLSTVGADPARRALVRRARAAGRLPPDRGGESRAPAPGRRHGGALRRAEPPRALSRAGVARTRSVSLAVVAAPRRGYVIASSASRHWQTFLLWRHRQPFGVLDPLSGKDVGFFVFSLPSQLLASRLLLWLIAVAAASAGSSISSDARSR